MNKFNLVMTLLVAVVVIFFGVNIAQKANYKIAVNDTVSLAYTINEGENAYDQSATITVGSNDDKIFTDKALTGVKNGSSQSFDIVLPEEIVIDDETTLNKGTEVTIDAKVLDVVPGETDEETSSDASEVSSETASE